MNNIRCIFLLLGVSLFASIVFAQNQPPAKTQSATVTCLHDDALARLDKESAAIDDESLLKIFWYTAPFNGHYSVLDLLRDGSSTLYTFAEYKGIRASHRKTFPGQPLGAKELERISVWLANRRLRPHNSASAPRQGEETTIIVFHDDKESRRQDYYGELPVEAFNLVAFVRCHAIGGLAKDPCSLYVNPFELIRRPRRHPRIY